MNDPLMSEALGQLGRAIVMHLQFGAAHDGILSLVRQSCASNVPFGATVIGPSGAGKSTLVAAIMRSMQSTDLLGERPAALHLSVQATPSVGQLIGGMLTQLSFPPTIRPAKIYEQSEDLMRALKERRIKLLFINEGQHLTAGRRNKSSTTITDYLKLVVDETNIVVVVLALPVLGHLRDVNDQLHSRSPARFPLDAFRDDEHWVALLQGISKECSAVRLAIVCEQFARATFKATHGLLRPLKQLLVGAVGNARSRGLTAVDARSLQESFHLLFSDGGSVPNPFLPRGTRA